MADHKGNYYVPEHSKWPILAAIALFCIGLGAVNLLHAHLLGPILFGIGVLLLIYIMVGWFGNVIKENRSGLYSAQMDRSFRWGMVWFIFSEIMFFAAFFGALFYARFSSVPFLAGASDGQMTHLLLWPNFKDFWPLLKAPADYAYTQPHQVINPWGIPALNTLILLTSGVTITWAHWSLKRNNRTQLLIGLLLTIVLGIVFLCLQAHEYILAHLHYNLKMTSGIYGSTFFMLTGFHALHVTVGIIMLIVTWVRSVKGHFTPEDHFGFEATAWYWHFVDAVWLILFTCVYWL